MYGNGYFVMDANEFTCEQVESHSNGGISYFHQIGDTVTLEIDMEAKTAKFKTYVVGLPDTVQIAITSANVHKISVLSATLLQ